MQAASVPALIVSFAALAISLYGVVERRHAARREERLRFGTIVDELNNLRLEHVKQGTNFQYGELTDAIDARVELLAVQALKLEPRLRRSITSPEYRTLAAALTRAGLPVEAEQTWHSAARAAAEEGRTQLLWANRGFAYFLFTAGRLEDGRSRMRQALDTLGVGDDTARTHRIKTLRYWARAEENADPGGAEAAALMKAARQAVASLERPKARQDMQEFLDTDTGD